MCWRLNKRVDLLCGHLTVCTSPAYRQNRAFLFGDFLATSMVLLYIEIQSAAYFPSHSTLNLLSVKVRRSK